MKRLFILFALVVFCGVGCTEVDMNESIENGTTSEIPNADEIPNNQIWYTTTDGEAIDISLALWDEITNISAISNVYENGRGVLTFNGNVTTIINYAFNYGMATLKSVVMPKTVRHIGYGAFLECENLESITFSRDLLTIDDYAFYYCTSLKSLVLPERLSSIGMYAFAKCSSLEEIILPEGLKSIGAGAFSLCNIKSVTIPESVETIDAAAFTSPYLEVFKGKYASEDGRCLIVDGVLNSFAPAGLTEYATPNNATEIGDSAFAGCSNLTNITLSECVTSLGDYAFHGCHNLTHITISDSVTSIGEFAFCNCNNLKSITIPKSVMSLGRAAFYNCSKLTSITLPRGYSNCILSYFGIDTSKTCIKFS
jgi:hypothetical protein